MYVECFPISDIQRKLSLQIFHAFCRSLIIIMLALGGCLAETLLSKFYPHHCLGFFCCSFTTSALGGKRFCQTTFVTSCLVSGGIWTGYDCLSFIPLLPDGNQLIIHSCRFLDMEQNKFKLASCSAGRIVNLCALIKLLNFHIQKLIEMNWFGEAQPVK